MCRLKSTYKAFRQFEGYIHHQHNHHWSHYSCKLAKKMWMTQAELLNAVNHQHSQTSNVTGGSSSSTGRRRKREKKLNHNVASEEEMKECIWKQLPKELVLHVIAKLPIPELFRARSIDMAANNMVFEFLCREKEYSLSIRGVEVDGSTSKGFLRMHHHDTSTSNNSLVILQPMVLDCSKQAWHKLPFFPFQGVVQRRSFMAEAMINVGLY